MDTLFGDGLVCWALDLLGRAANWCLDGSLSGFVFICWTDGIAISYCDKLDFKEIYLTR
jgi:hypothetical protein